MLKNILILFLCYLVFSLANCSKETTPEDNVLAIVGDKVITVNEFRLNYEFGFPQLKKGADRKRSYLDYMIKESILSQEGYKLGLDKSERVQELELKLLDELLVEELYKIEISDKINISEQEIRDAIAKSKVKWKLRYWVEPNSVYANRVSQAMRQNGFAETLEDIFKSNPKVYFEPTDFETDYLSWLDVSEEMFDVIKDLPAGDISEPVELNGDFFIFQIIDIRQEPVGEYDYLNETDRYRKILFSKRFRKAASRYVFEFMTPKNVVTKNESFQILTAGVAEWMQIDKNSRRTLEQEIEAADSLKPSLYKLQKLLDKTLVEFVDGVWTIKDFINQFNSMAIKADVEDRDNFLNQINEQIALSVRDYFLAEKAKRMHLYKSKNVQKQLEMWRNKFVYNEMRQYLSAGSKIYEPKTSDENENAKNNFREDRIALLSNIDSLKTQYSIKINEAILDTIITIDSEKSRWHSLQVFTKSNNRLAIPVVDPALLLDN